MSSFMFVLKIREKSFEVIENVEKMRRLDPVMIKNLFAQTIPNKTFGTNRRTSVKLTGLENADIYFFMLVDYCQSLISEREIFHQN